MKKSIFAFLGILCLAGTAVAQKDSSAFFASVHGTVWAMQTINALYVAGSFDSVGGIAANSIARWDGKSWHPLGAGIHGDVRALLDDGHGGLYVGGKFDSAGEIATSNVAHWDSSGWSPLGAGVNNTVYALCIDTGVLFCGGSFDSAGLSQAQKVARWSDSAGWDTLPYHISNGSIRAISVGNLNFGEALLLGGDFTSVNDDTSLNFLIAAPSFLRVQTNGPVFAISNLREYPIWGGSFSITATEVPYQYPYHSQNLIQGWAGYDYPGVGGLWSEVIDSTVMGFAATDSKRFLMWGLFKHIDGSPISHVAFYDGAHWRPLLDSNSSDVTAGCWLGRDAIFSMKRDSALSSLFKWNYPDTIIAHVSDSPSYLPDGGISTMTISNDSASNAILYYHMGWLSIDLGHDLVNNGASMSASGKLEPGQSDNISADFSFIPSGTIAGCVLDNSTNQPNYWELYVNGASDCIVPALTQSAPLLNAFAANGHVTIKITNTESGNKRNIFVYRSDGRCYFMAEVSAGEQSVTTSALPIGDYFIVFQTASGEKYFTKVSLF